MKQIPINIKVQFNGEIFHLKNHESRQLSGKTGVEVYLEMRPGNEVKPVAVTPEYATVEQYKHCRPKILSCDWVTVE